MSEHDPDGLSPETRALIAAARDAHEPTAAERKRVLEGLEAKLAAGVVATSFASTAYAAATKVIVGVVVAGGLSLGAMQAFQPAEPKTVSSVTPAVAPEVHEPVLEPDDEIAPAVPDASLAEEDVDMPGRAARRPRRRAPTLSEETALLREVNGAINRGDGARALALLAQYDRRFKGGRLWPERSAARVLALCLAGRRAAAEAEAARFVSRWPRSPLLARLHDSCAAAGVKRATP